MSSRASELGCNPHHERTTISPGNRLLPPKQSRLPALGVRVRPNLVSIPRLGRLPSSGIRCVLDVLVQPARLYCALVVLHSTPERRRGVRSAPVYAGPTAQTLHAGLRIPRDTPRALARRRLEQMMAHQGAVD